MKLEYDQCFYKYIEQKTKELFMSVHSVNGISQMQNAQGVSFGSSNQDDGSGPDIGKLLVGTVLVAAVAGVGIAGYKSGKTLTKEGDGVLATVWNGIKSWFGKNGNDVAQAAKNDIPAECKTSLKTFFSGGDISQTQKQDILENTDEISKVFSEKAKNNATKADKLAEIAKIKDTTEKTNALADFFRIEKKLTLTTDDKLDITGLSLDDQAIIARKLKDPDGNLITGSIGDIIDGLQNKYTTKNKNYNLASNKLKNLTDVDTIIPKTATPATPATPVAPAAASADDVNNIIAKRFNRAGAAQKIVDNCTDTSSYINTQASLTKWLKAGDLTQDEYDNLRALAEQKFMSKNSGTDYLNYMTQGLMKKDGKNPIELNKLASDDIATLNKQFPWLKLDEENTSLTSDVFVAKRKESATSISEYLGFNGHSLSSEDASSFKLVDGNLVWEASAGGGTAPTKIFGRTIGSNCVSTIESGTATRMTLTLDNLKKIFNPLPTMLV